MNLIEIVKSEYATFPDTDYCYLTQNADGDVHMWVDRPVFKGDDWYQHDKHHLYVGNFLLADDYETAVVVPSDFVATTDRLYEIQKEVRKLEGEITERIETIRELKKELAQHGFSMPFHRPRRNGRRR